MGSNEMKLLKKGKHDPERSTRTLSQLHAARNEGQRHVRLEWGRHDHDVRPHSLIESVALTTPFVRPAGLEPATQGL